MASFRIVFPEAADHDILVLITRSRNDFGVAAANRYRALLSKALHDLATDPFRPGTRSRQELGAGLYTYHLTHSRSRTGVKAPRHLIAYSVQESSITILRILHERSDLHRHIN